MHSDLKEILIINNSGLAILWPYLAPLFERAELTADNRFLDEAAQQKAILLSQFLVTGDDVPPQEYQLGLNKVICGYPISTPIGITYDISEELKELCEGLLSAVIAHWDILGDTSIEAFRESFLIREGTLGLEEEKWRLKVSSKAYDVLISQIPWGIEVVNLSWMDRVLMVDWR